MPRIPVDAKTAPADNDRPSLEAAPVSEYKKIGESMGLSGNLIVVPQPARSAPPSSGQQTKSAPPATPEPNKREC